MSARDGEEIIYEIIYNSWTKFPLNKRQPSKLKKKRSLTVKATTPLRPSIRDDYVLINVTLSCLLLQWIFKRPSNEVKIKLTIKHLAFANSLKKNHVEDHNMLKQEAKDHFTHVPAHKLKRTPSRVRYSVPISFYISFYTGDLAGPGLFKRWIELSTG